MDWYYDNCCDPNKDAPAFLDIDRIYCFILDDFSDADWKRLAAIYEQLPGWCTGLPDGCPAWFGNDTSTRPFLYASVEPPGLQVAGALLPESWAEWDSRFRELAADLPRYALD